MSLGEAAWFSLIGCNLPLPGGPYKREQTADLCTIGLAFCCSKGATFDRQRHVVGTEIKAITYSAMAVSETPDKSDIFVIVDI